MKLLLDTNAYSELKRGHPGVADLVRRAQRLYLSSIVVGELLYGFRLGRRYRENRSELETFLARERIELVSVTLATADRFGQIMTGLRRQGTPIPTNDVWIAAHAMETGAELLSFDGHFDQVAGLAVLSPS